MFLQISNFILIILGIIKIANGRDIGLVMTGVRTRCDTDVCKNGGICRMLSGTDEARSFTCECLNGWAGQLCDVPQPTLQCDNQEISVIIDKRLVSQNGLDNNEALISFMDGDDEGCTAVKDGDNYKLTIKSPFSKHCGTEASRGDSGNYLFHNEVIWKKLYAGNEGEASIQRKIKLVDFKCDYEDEYLLHLHPITPAEATIEQQTEKGNFNVAMKMFKNPLFDSDPNGQYDANPIIRIDQEVCIMLDLSNNLGFDHLVLTASSCWGSAMKNPEESNRHYIIQNKCEATSEYSTNIIGNGISTTVQFCFKLYKWLEDMDQVYLQCQVAVCDSRVTVRGVSQCQCPPKGYDVHRFFYPNYYYKSFKHMNLIDKTNNYEGMYGDYVYDNPDYYYYDYGVDTEEDMEINNFTYQEYSDGKKRKRRSTSDQDNNTTEPEATEPKKQLNKKKISKEDIQKPINLQDVKIDAEGNRVLPPNIKIDPKRDLIDIGYGPIRVKDALDPNEHSKAMATIETMEIEDKGEWFENPATADNVVLIAVGGSLIFAMIVLGVVIGVYVQFRNAANQKAQKSLEDQHKVREFYQGVLKTGAISPVESSEKQIAAFVRDPK